jgi:hypothetical protein
MRLHPVFLAPARGGQARDAGELRSGDGAFSIPPRTAVVFVED